MIAWKPPIQKPLIYGSEEAKEQKHRDRIMGNREQVEQLIKDAIFLDTKLGKQTPFDEGVFLAECVIEEISDEDWLMLKGFFTHFFNWIDDNYDHLIPQKYQRPYVIMQELKRLVQDD